ncbi:hypothetical protein R3P38DRAFT_2802148 [Favolaschia claudopus]|uniref:Aminoglycoside phosphotransferase domain-containing protein n=1 Tax=Favolaschia claudopus TaxID=2862362 RepID=A0AAV9ZVR3_9AGAR
MGWDSRIRKQVNRDAIGRHGWRRVRVVRHRTIGFAEGCIVSERPEEGIDVVSLCTHFQATLIETNRHGNGKEREAREEIAESFAECERLLDFDDRKNAISRPGDREGIPYVGCQPEPTGVSGTELEDRKIGEENETSFAECECLAFELSWLVLRKGHYAVVSLPFLVRGGGLDSERRQEGASQGTRHASTRAQTGLTQEQSQNADKLHAATRDVRVEDEPASRGIVTSETPNPIENLQEVLSACGLPSPTPDELTALRPGKEPGRQAVFAIAQKWIVRIFELHEGYKQPASFLWRILKELEHRGAPSERIRFYGTLPTNKSLHYTVTDYFDGVPLTHELCALPQVREQIVALYRHLGEISVPDTVATVEDYMRPRLELLQRKLSGLSPDIIKQVGQLSPLAELSAFHMLLSHRDLAPENIIAHFGPSVNDCESMTLAVIDWEFAAYVPEFHVGLQMGNRSGRELWGDDFLLRIGLGKSYPERILWTESLCMLAEDYAQCEALEFEAQVNAVILGWESNHVFG